MFSRERATVAYTLERCASCGAERKRRFREGDVLFAAAACGSCGGAAAIEKIFGELQD